MSNSLREIMSRCGVHEYGVIDSHKVAFLDEVRTMCEANTCRSYGKSWACPPAVGTVAECRERCQKFEKLVLFSGKYDLEDSFDFEGMAAGMSGFKNIARALEAEVKPYLEDYLILSNEGCDLCETCTYPDNPCRHPDRAHGSIEGYGIMVSTLAKQVGIHYINGSNTVSYFGALLYSGDAISES